MTSIEQTGVYSVSGKMAENEGGGMVGDGFKALSDPTRRRILELLGEHDMTASEIGVHFPQSKATLSHHLEALREAGLVKAERQGRRVLYQLDTTVLQSLIAWFYSLAESEGNDELKT